jgi:lipopolysaccharide export system protein LptA
MSLVAAASPLCYRKGAERAAPPVWRAASGIARKVLYVKTFRALSLVVLLASAAPAFAQTQTTTSGFQGFSSDSSEPVNIESDNLDVRDNQNIAIFTGNVVAVQGDTTLRSEKLTIYYSPNKPDQAAGQTNGQANAQKPATPSSAPAQAGQPASTGQASTGKNESAAGRKIDKLDAVGHVIVTSKDQRATGSRGIFDLVANTMTMTGGDVVLTQGGNVIHGTRLFSDRNTNETRVEGGKQRVRGLFIPNNNNNNSGAGTSGARSQTH